MKYIPGGEKTQDNLILKMDELNEEQAFSLIMELLSSLSFGLNAVFDSEGGNINHLEKFDWKTVACSTVGNRRVLRVQSMEDFVYVRPLKSDKEIMLARLYRTALACNDIYSQILFFWHCLCYSKIEENKIDESKVVGLINRYHQNIPKEMDINKGDIEFILKEPFFSKNYDSVLTIGEYIQKGIRHSIAHIVRDIKHNEKGLEIDSLQELRHLHKVKNILKAMSRYRMEYDLEMKRPDDSNYFTYFIPCT